MSTYFNIFVTYFGQKCYIRITYFARKVYMKFRCLAITNHTLPLFSFSLRQKSLFTNFTIFYIWPLGPIIFPIATIKPAMKLNWKWPRKKENPFFPYFIKSLTAFRTLNVCEKSPRFFFLGH